MISRREYGREEATQGRSSFRFRKGQIIYLQDDKARHWYRVSSGIVRTCRLHADGHRQLTGFFYPDDVFGVEEGVYSEFAEAVTDVALVRFPNEGFDASPFDRRSNQSSLALQRALKSAQQCIFLLGHRTAAQRLAAFLLTMATRMGGHGGVQLPMSRTDIADHLGLTIHTVSRTICEFARRRLIALDGPQHIRIIDFAELRELAGETEPPLDRGGEEKPSRLYTVERLILAED